MNTEYTGPERRKHKRLKANFIVIYQVRKPVKVIMFVEDKEINAVMLDLSEGGMAILTDYDLPTTTTLHTRFTLINIYAHKDARVKSMKIVGEICNNLFIEKTGYRLGIRFVDISEEDKLSIFEFVRLTAGR